MNRTMGNTITPQIVRAKKKKKPHKPRKIINDLYLYSASERREGEGEGGEPAGVEVCDEAEERRRRRGREVK